jgi:hypothetical protein
MTDRVQETESFVNRRGFLRGSTWAVAGIALTALFPQCLLAGQDGRGAPPGADDDKKDDKKTETHDDEKGKDAKENDKDRDAKDDETKTDSRGETRRDAAGIEYRVCPQCGSNMYRQNQTWTCENCGYSYVE